MSKSLSSQTQSSQVQSSSVDTAGSRSISSRRSRKGRDKNKLFEIDFIGNESMVRSQNNILLKRSVEPATIATNIEGQLSARGLHHRGREHFTKDLRDATAIILNAQKENRGAKKDNKPSGQLLAPHFVRALSFERLDQPARALKDYDMVLKIDDQNANAYFNRANLHEHLGDDESAIKDLERAIDLDPMNMTYRNNKARMYRRQGKYMEAIRETIIYRAIETQPDYMEQEFERDKNPVIDASALKKKALPKDPIIVALSLPKEQRRKKQMASVVDFLSQLKFFAPFKNDNKTLDMLASSVELYSYEKDEFIFEEGMLGDHFFMILDGEVSIVKCRKNQDGDILHTNILVKLFRGQTFGETALEKEGGVRSAGALASQMTHLLGLHRDIYKKVVGAFKQQIRTEVRLVLASCPAFSEFTAEALDTLARDAILRNYSSNKEILREGDESKYLYIVKQGLVKVVKRLKKPKVGNIKVFTPYSGKVQKPEPPGLWVLEKSFTIPVEHNKKGKKNDDSKGGTKFPPVGGSNMDADDEKSVTSISSHLKEGETEFTVGVVASGQIFGELALINPETKSPTTAISTTPCEVFLLDGATVSSLGAKYSTKCMNALTEGITLHNPPTEKLKYFFRAKYVQERQMKDMLNIMSIDTLKGNK